MRMLFGVILLVSSLTAACAQQATVPNKWPPVTVSLTADENNNLRVLLDVAQKAAGTQATIAVAAILAKLDAAGKEPEKSEKPEPPK
jgi:hypothetical protein